MGTPSSSIRVLTRRPSAAAAALCLASGLVLGLVPPPPVEAATTAVSIVDFQFVAPTVTVTAGDTVTWTDNGNAPHSVTADDGSFDSSPNCGPTCLANGDTFSHQFTTPGTFAYHCRLHGAAGGVGMSGVVVVNAQVTTTTTAPTTTTTAAVTTVAPSTVTTIANTTPTVRPVTVAPTFTG